MNYFNVKDKKIKNEQIFHENSKIEMIHAKLNFIDKIPIIIFLNISSSKSEIEFSSGDILRKISFLNVYFLFFLFFLSKSFLNVSFTSSLSFLSFIFFFLSDFLVCFFSCFPYKQYSSWLFLFFLFFRPLTFLNGLSMKVMNPRGCLIVNYRTGEKLKKKKKKISLIRIRFGSKCTWASFTIRKIRLCFDKICFCCQFFFS